jgi:hypothetical protein
MVTWEPPVLFFSFQNSSSADRNEMDHIMCGLKRAREILVPLCGLERRPIPLNPLIVPPTTIIKSITYCLSGRVLLRNPIPKRTRPNWKDQNWLGKFVERETTCRRCQATRINHPPPVLAIGGIDESNCHIPIQFGANGVATIRAVLQAQSPLEVIQEIKSAMIGAS